jgi:protocatechuate 3,4-dioxygenase beta subunit
MPRLILGLVVAGAVVVSAQTQPPAGSAAATRAVAVGRVVADATGEPIRNARVTLSPSSKDTPVVLTDADGRFRLAAPSGRYRVVASKPGCVQGSAPANTAGAPVELRLKKAAAIGGKIVDDRGEPVAGVKVAALSAESARTSVATTETDDRGEYRFGGLSEGAFLVRVTTLGAAGAAARPAQWVPDPRGTYYSGVATTDDAQAVPLQTGEEREGIDIVVSADRLAGMPAAIFDNRFLPRPPAAAVQLGFVKPVVRPTGSIRGRVASIDGTPIQRAHVYLFTGENADSRMATTDGDGRFEVESIVAGPLLVSVVRPGYAQVESGRTLALFQMGRAVTSPSPAEPQFGRRLELAPDEHRNLDLLMARWSTVSGTITDEYGDPMQGVEVDVLHLRYQAGRRRLVSAGPSRFTDERGRYRLYGLAPGRYVVSAAVGQASSDDLPGYARAYYPGTASTAEARYVTLGPAEDVDFVDVSMPRTTPARILGTVLDPAGEPTMPGRLTLAPSQRSSSITSVPVGGRVAADGTFVFPNVAPGEYVIQASRGRANAHTEGVFGAALVSIGTTDVAGVVVRTSIGSSIAGRFRLDLNDTTKPTNPADVELTAVPVDFDSSPPATNTASAEIRRDWTFEISGLNGPRRLQLTRPPAGLALQEIRVNGLDVTDRPIPFGTRAQSLSNVEVVLTDRVAELDGRVVDDRARPLAGATVVVFSADRQRWYQESRFIRRVSTGQDGVFTVVGLPTGSYYAASADGPEAGEDAWQDPEYLESLVPGATTVSVVEGMKDTVTVVSR